MLVMIDPEFAEGVPDWGSSHITEVFCACLKSNLIRNSGSYLVSGSVVFIDAFFLDVYFIGLYICSSTRHH